MTISSLAKIIVGVNRMVVENVEIEYPEINPTLIISVRPTKIKPNYRKCSFMIDG